MNSFFSFRHFFLGVLLLLPCWVSAQESLSLEQAVGKGLENNYAIRIAALDEDIAQNNNTWGAAGRWPQLSFSLPGTYSRFNNPGSFLAGRENIVGNLSLDWVVFDGYGIQANKERFALLEEQSAGNAAIVIENNIQAIVLGYNQVLVQSAQLDVLQEVLDNSKERLAYEQYRKDLGTGSTFELLQFKNAVLTDSTNLITQSLNARNAQRNLNLVMGVPVDQSFFLTDSLQVDFQVYDIQELEKRMLENNHNIRNQYTQLAIRQQESRIARSVLYPSLSIGGNTTYSFGNIILRNRDPDTVDEMPTITNKVSAFDYSAGFTIAFTLFNGGNARRQIQNARISEEVSVLQIDELTQTLRNELFARFDDYRARRQILAIQAANLQVAVQNLEMAAERFENGLINSFDYRSIQLQYLNIQVGQFNALQNLKETETELIRLMGGLVRQN